jgi:hypothetical protein
MGAGRGRMGSRGSRSSSGGSGEGSSSGSKMRSIWSSTRSSTRSSRCRVGGTSRPSGAALLLVVVLLGSRGAPTVAAGWCNSDSDCSLNGVCTTTVSAGGRRWSQSCVCDEPWTGASCGELSVLPAPPGGAYGYGDGRPFAAASSWGGNAIEGDDGLWHLFVTEIAGKGCGLHGWSSASTVRHATAAHPAGPYAPRDLALPHEAHNPQTVRIGDAWYIFHIGEALGGAEPPPCDERPPPHDADEFGRPIGARAGGSKIHRAVDPNGPWLPLVRCLPANARAPSTSCGNALSRIVRVSSRASERASERRF